MMKYQYIPIKRNFTSRGKTPIEYIVIHDTGNTGKGANAKAHKNYVENNSRGASAHYFVDDTGIVQYVGDSKAAGAVGDGHGKYGIKNSNSLSIEICINADGNYDKTYKNAVELTKNLMAKFKIPPSKVVRHYDASRKICPGHMQGDNWARWWKFKKDIEKPIEWQIDLSKNSEFGDDKMSEDKPSVWAEEAWKWGQDKGLTDGTNPQGTCTREQLITILYRALADKEPT